MCAYDSCLQGIFIRNGSLAVYVKLNTTFIPREVLRDMRLREPIYFLLEECRFCVVSRYSSIAFLIDLIRKILVKD
jgi:hypothetical protein